MDEIVKLYYNKTEPHDINCFRIKYIEENQKKMKIKQAVCLANCFVNSYWLKTIYSEEIKKKFQSNLPNIFKNEIKLPTFYTDIILKKLNNK